MSKVDDILTQFGMTRENWECDPLFVVSLMNALEDSPSEAPREGWKLVPVKPTKDMLESVSSPEFQMFSHGQILDVYQRMLAFAPSSSAAEQDK